MSNTTIAKALDVLTAKMVEMDGPSIVRDAFNEANWDEYGQCKHCDTEVPSHEGVCLLCGSPAERLTKKKYTVRWVESKGYSATVEVPGDITDIEDVEDYCYDIVMNEVDESKVTFESGETTLFDVEEAR